MNTQEIKEHAERLLSAVANVEAAEEALTNLKWSDYYEIFGIESERDRDVAAQEDLLSRCSETLLRELRIGQILIES